MQTNNLIEKNKHPYNDIMSQRYDWLIIKTEYVEGYIDEKNNHIWPTMKKLSVKHAVPSAYLRRIASLQQWTTEKQNFITNYEHAKQEEKIKLLDEKSAKFDAKCIKIASAGIKEIEKLLCNTINMNLDDNGEDVRPILTMESLEAAAKTLEKFQKVGRLALGNSTDNVTKSIKAAGESIPFSVGMDTVMKQIESNPELHKKIEDEFIDE